ncbi:MFS transporter [Aquamicrobium sp. NLF2-7]|uniref:MFS transporter n=1 Tax=Aquamicrobium sp. NLF2-7 TaxID=2918753 RepID=UPI001EFB9776|nr:MFS transporter [Aquamicrobium sp. NLF2-7]MCG8273905.1 MFS transporter [Aquamicrobium sp. NLF2-7]
MALRNYTFLGLLMLCGFAIVGQLYVTIPLVPQIAANFGVTASKAALAGTAFGFAYAAGFLILGPLTDRFNRKRVILAGLILTAIATILVGMANSFGLLLILRAVQGLAASLFPPAALSLIAEDLPQAHRPLGISLMSFAFLGAAPLAQFFGGEIGDLSLIMFAIVPLYLIGAVGLQFTTNAGQGGLKAAGPTTRPKPGIGSLLQNAAIPPGWLAAFTVLFSFVMFHSGAQALNDGLAIDLQSLRLVGLPPLLLTIAAAPVTRRFGPSVTARLGLVIMVFGLSLAALGTSVAVLAASAIVSAGVAFAVPGLIGTVASEATNDNRGLALAVYTFSLFLGASVAPPVAQALAAYGSGPTWLLPAITLVVAALVITISMRRKTTSMSTAK